MTSLQPDGLHHTTHLQLCLQHLAEAGGHPAQVPVPPLHLRLQAPLELGTEDLLLTGEVYDALLHPGELRGQELLELCAVRVDLGIGPEDNKVLNKWRENLQ